MKTYTVTAFVKSKGRRDTISKRLSKVKAKSFASKLRYEMKIAIPKYRSFSKIKIESK